jgi:hypothetical protein
MHEHRGRPEVLSANGDTYLLLLDRPFARRVEHSKRLYNELNFGVYKDCIMLQRMKIDSSPYRYNFAQLRLMKRLITKHTAYNLWDLRKRQEPVETKLLDCRSLLLGPTLLSWNNNRD